jgi:DNA mismatch endonuclease (patch repair protein)
MTDKLSPEQRRKNMQAIKGKNTSLERLLASALWKMGLRYRKNDRSVFGTPDFVFKGKKVAVFVDSEFWHGKDWKTRKETIKTNREFWIAKIEANIRRDILVNITLQEKGWTVFRFWGKEIEKETGRCAEEVFDALQKPTEQTRGKAAEKPPVYKKIKRY